MAKQGPEDMAELINLVMDRTGLTQTQLAEVLGVTQGHISRISRDHYEPKVGEFQALAHAFGGDPELREAIIHFTFN